MRSRVADVVPSGTHWQASWSSRGRSPFCKACSALTADRSPLMAPSRAVSRLKQWPSYLQHRPSSFHISNTTSRLAKPGRLGGSNLRILASLLASTIMKRESDLACAALMAQFGMPSEGGELEFLTHPSSLSKSLTCSKCPLNSWPSSGCSMRHWTASSLALMAGMLCKGRHIQWRSRRRPPGMYLLSCKMHVWCGATSRWHEATSVGLLVN